MLLRGVVAYFFGIEKLLGRMECLELPPPLSRLANVRWNMLLLESGKSDLGWGAEKLWAHVSGTCRFYFPIYYTRHLSPRTAQLACISKLNWGCLKETRPAGIILEGGIHFSTNCSPFFSTLKCVWTKEAARCPSLFFACIQQIISNYKIIERSILEISREAILNFYIGN